MVRLRRRSDALLVVVDVSMCLGVCAFAYRLRFEGVALPGGILARYEGVTIALLVAWPVAARASGLYKRSALRPSEKNTEAAVEGSLGVGLALLIVDAVGLGGNVSRAWIGLVVLGLGLAGVSSRGVLRRSRRLLVPLGVGLERYALVGEDAAARRLLGDLTRAPGAPFRIVGTLPGGLSAEELARRAKEMRVDGLIVPVGAEPRQVGRLASHLSGAGIDVLLAPGLGQLELRVASIAMLHGVPLLRAAGLSPRRRAIRSSGRRSLKHGVAILGTRGIPANYGGFETFAERLALHLKGEGIPTTVYCRSHYATEGASWRGIRLVTLPTIRSKYFDTVVHTLLSALHLSLTTRCRDVVLCNAANAPVLLLLRLFRCRVLLNVDGLEWRRSKWGVAGRSWYRLGEWLSVRLATVLVTDADEVQTYYRVRHDTDSIMIPYGADSLARHLEGFPVDVEPDNFVLYVSRWERENNPVMVAAAHAESGVDAALVMLGSTTYDDELATEVHAAAGPRAILPGAVFGDGYRALQSSALCYVHATEVGGTHPALIEAMGAGNVCLVMDTPENREVAGPAGALFFADEAELAALLVKVVNLSVTELETLRERAREHARVTYSWSAVGKAYEGLLRGA